MSNFLQFLYSITLPEDAGVLLKISSITLLLNSTHEQTRQAITAYLENNSLTFGVNAESIHVTWEN